MTNLGDDDVDSELLATIVAGLAPVEPHASLKERLMGSLAGVSQLEHFSQRIAALVDIARAPAQALLAALADAERWIGAGTEMALFHVDGGPRLANAIVGFVRMPAGACFPEHEHVGAELMLVLQGGLVVDGVTHRAGAELTSPAGSSHTFAAAEGPDLLYLGIIQGGMNIDGNHISPSNPTY